MFSYIQNNWVFVQRESILEQLILGVRYQDIRLLYDGSSDHKYWMGRGCFKGNSINDAISQLKSFLKNTKELVVWEVSIEDTTSNYICGDNKLEWDQEVVNQLVWQLEYDLGDWLIKPGENISDVWETTVSKLYQGSDLAEGQGRLILATQESKFLPNNTIFFKKPLDTFTTSGTKEELFDYISNFQATQKLFSFEAHRNPSLSDFTSDIKEGSKEIFNFAKDFAKSRLY